MPPERPTATGRKIDVVFVHRRPQAGYFSLEALFAAIRLAMPSDIGTSVWHCPWPSRGLWRRVANAVAARFAQGTVTHITGDVHYVVLLMRRDRTLLTVPDVVLLHRLTGLRRWVASLFWFDLPVRRAAIVTTISESVRQELIRATRCRPDKVVAIHVPIGLHFRRIPRPFRADCPRILMIGTAWNKNLVRQSEALAGLSCEVDYVGTLGDEHRRALESSGVPYRVWNGLSDAQMLERYAECDILLFASLYEGFGMPIVEAHTVGRPVVTSSRSSMPEIAGEAACFVDPEDVESIRRGVRRVTEDAVYRSALVEHGYSNAERFSPVAIAARYAELYRALSTQ